MTYSTLDELYNLALTARAFEVVPSPIAMVDIYTGKIRLPSHGYGAADLILFSATSGGALPPELDAFTYYSPIIVGGDIFQVNDGTGQPVIFTAEPRGWAVKVDPVRRVTIHQRDAYGRINLRLGGHAAPIKPDPDTGLYPPVLVGLEARMAARSAVTSLQIENPAYRIPMDRLFASAATDGDTNPPGQPGSILGDFAHGLEIRGAVDQDTVADMSARARNAFSPGPGYGANACGCNGYHMRARRSL